MRDGWLSGLSDDEAETAGPSDPFPARLSRYLTLRTEIEDFWLRPENRQTQSWLDHRNINDVMLATALSPDGYLGREPETARGPAV